MTRSLAVRTNRWRKKGKRGVSPIIATILLVAITVVLAAVLYILISGLTKGPGSTPIGTALALGAPAEASVAGKFWYNFSIQSAGGGIIANNLNFQVQTASGSIVTLTGTMSLLNLAGTAVGTYPFTGATANSWTVGGTIPLSSSQTMSLQNGVSLSGDKLITSGAGSFQGAIQTQIP